MNMLGNDKKNFKTACIKKGLTCIWYNTQSTIHTEKNKRRTLNDKNKKEKCETMVNIN